MVQLKIKEFVQGEDEILEIDTHGERFIKKKVCEYLGIEIPKDRLCINGKGKISMAKPKCPECVSFYISNNGSKKRTPKTLIGKPVELTIQ